MKVLLTTLNAKYIHKNLALRWIYQACPYKQAVTLIEYTIKDDLHRICDEIVLGNYDLICFSVYIWNIEPIKQLIAQLKKRQPNVHILVGGPEVSYESDELLDQGVDAISIGEGEQSVWEYVDMIKHRESYEISGICTKAYPNHDQRKTPLSYLETLEDPYFMEFDQADMDKRYLYLETSRGCPYGCEYCLSSCDRQVRMFSLPYVMKLLEKIKHSKVKQVKLLDRTFNVDPDRALSIARYMNEECTNQIFQFEVVAETLSEELLQFFETEADQTRFRFEVGVQSFHKDTLQAVGRIQNNKRLKEVITRLRSANVILHVDLIAGLPYEDEPTFEHSFNELFALHASECQLGILKLLKGTKLKEKRTQYGFVYETIAPYAIQKTNWLSEEELVSINDTASAVEKYWNSGKCQFTIQELLTLGYETSAYQLFKKLGSAYQKLPRPYAPQQFFQAFLSAFPQLDSHMLCAMLNMDYYRLAKQRPPHFHEDKLSMEIRKQLKEAALSQGIASYELDHYASMTYGWNHHTIGYQLILYTTDSKAPKRYWINQTMTECEEL